MIKIFIDAGHGGRDGGATGYGLKEKDLTLTIAKKIQSILKGVATVKMSRTTDKFLSLTERTNMANKWGADYFLSVHINAGGGTGYEDYIYNELNSNSKAAQFRNTVHAEIIKWIPNVTNRGKKKANFAVVRQSRMPAMLSENLFIDRKEDAALLKDGAFLDELAKGHAYGIAKAFSLGTPTEKPAISTIPSKPSNSSKPSSGSSSYTGSSIVDYLKSKGIDSSLANRKKLAAQYSIKNYTGTANENINLLNKIKSGKRQNNTSSRSATVTFKKGAKVKIKNGAGNYSRTMTAIPKKWKNINLTIQQVDKNDVLLEEVYSWVKKSDIIGGSSSISKSKSSSVKAGDTVTLKKSANRFTTGETIASHVKGKKYKIHQTKGAQVLLKSGSSYLGWVKKSDVQ